MQVGIEVLINNRHNPVNLEPGTVSRLQWRFRLVDSKQHYARHSTIQTSTYSDATLEFQSTESDQSDCYTSHWVGDCTYYRIIVSSTQELAKQCIGDIWDSGRSAYCANTTQSDSTSTTAYAHSAYAVDLTQVPMTTSCRYWATVELWDQQLSEPLRSAVITFGTGPSTSINVDVDHQNQLGDTRGWVGVPIWIRDSEAAPGWAMLRTTYTLPEGRHVQWATLHITAASTAPARQFVYRLWADQQQLGVGPVFPIQTEARYDGYDLTELINTYYTSLHTIHILAYTQEDQRVLAQLDICLDNGEMLHIGTNHTWQGCSAEHVYQTAGSIGTQYFEAPAEEADVEQYEAWFDTDSTESNLHWMPAVERQPFQQIQASPVDPMVPRLKEPSSIRSTEDGRVIIDFGCTVMGGIQLDAVLDQPLVCTIRCAEVMDGEDSVRYQLSTGNTYEDQWYYPAGRHMMQHWGIRVFRYVEISSSDGQAARLVNSGMLRCQAVALEQSRPVYASEARYTSSDVIVDSIWQLCAHTIAALNANIYVDSWTRERAPYEADAWIQQRSHYALEYAPALGGYTMQWLAHNRTWPTEWPLYTILAVYDIWIRTGQLDYVMQIFNQLRSLLPDAYVDTKSGFIVKDPGQSSHRDGDLVDWPQGERDGYVFGRVNTVINALASQAYMDMSEMAQAIGLHKDAVRWRTIALRMRQAIHSELYESRVGAYSDGFTHGPEDTQIPHYALHATAFVIAFADPPSERIPQLQAWVSTRGMACSVYTAAVYMTGLYQIGMGQYAYTLLTASGDHTWSHMIDQGAGSTMEAWSLACKSNTTYSHPWASSPLYVLEEGLCGIRPLAPGYSRIAIIPQPGGATAWCIQAPLAHGDIRVEWKGKSGRDCNTQSVGASCASTSCVNASCVIQLAVTLPPDTTAEVVLLPDVLPSFALDKNEKYNIQIQVDGETWYAYQLATYTKIADVWCAPQSLVLPNMHSGMHNISVIVCEK